jgi:hypothetical protein
MCFDKSLADFFGSCPNAIAGQMEAAGIQPAAEKFSKKRKRLVKPPSEQRTDPD